MAEEQKKSKGVFRRLLIFAVIIAAGFALWNWVIRKRATPKSIVEVSGRVESDDSAVAAKIAGRIREITVREGDQVKAGQVIAVLDDPQTQAREEQARSMLSEASARLQRANEQIGVLSQQLDQSRMMTDQSKLD